MCAFFYDRVWLIYRKTMDDTLVKKECRHIDIDASNE